MRIYVSQACSCEHSGCYGYETNHQRGDQMDGKEVRTDPYYNFPWVYAYRCKDANCASAIATRQAQAADLLNPTLGYSQPGRMEYLAALEKIPNYDPSKITTTCDCDCSSLTNGNVYVTLKSVGITSNITGHEVTAQMPAVYSANPYFEDVTSKVNFVTGEGLQKGDILVSPGKHCAVVTFVEQATDQATEQKEEQKTGTVTTGLYMRTGTVTNGILATGNPILTIPQGATVTINSSAKNAAGRAWYNVTYNGKTGWSSSAYIKVK